MTVVTALPDRAVVAVDGPDRIAFLQGLVSNDVTEAVPGRAVWAALLTPQGKYLADFFVLSDGVRLFLDSARTQSDWLLRTLSRYRLRAAVSLSLTDWVVHATWGGLSESLPAETLTAPDPRLPDAGSRILSPTALAGTAGPEDWDRHRLRLGLPDGTRDMEPEKTVLLEAGFDELGGVSWSKGCYMGQELTARTKYRGLVKRRLVPVGIAGPAPQPGTPILSGGAEVGTMRSSRDDLGLALLRIETLRQPLDCGHARLTPHVPDWMRLPEQATAP